MQTLKTASILDDPSFLDQNTSQILAPLLQPKVKAILVKGEPGVGKTTFALELLRMYGKGVYVSTRIGEDQILEQFPALKEQIEKGDVLEIKSEKPPTTTANGSDNQQHSHQMRFDDLRLATAQDVIESVLQSISIALEPLIILDSWDAIAKELDHIERLRVEKSLALITLGNKSRLVFVSEDPNLTTTDYLVDAVITLKNDFFEGRRVRRMEFNKIRGSSIPQCLYAYTLNGGRFTLFTSPRIWTSPQYQARQFQPIKLKDPGRYSTGSEDFDAFLGGGLKKGQVIILELGKFAGSSWQFPLLIPVCCNFLLNGGCAISLPSGGVSPAVAMEIAKAHVPTEILESRFRVASFYVDRSTIPQSIPLDPDSLSKSFDDLIYEARNIKKGPQVRPAVYFIGIDTLESYFGPDEILKVSISAIQTIKQLNDVAFMIVRTGTSCKQVLADRFDLYLKLDEVQRSLAMYSVKPPSELYNVRYEYDRGFPDARLTPIV